jgi:CheY-like chemotaxis protein
MDKETMQRIFEPFFTTKEMSRGTGLGLASVFGIIKGHRGYIDVESEEGQGTTFTIYLPASDQRIGNFPEAPQSDERIVPASGHILLVDDEAMVLEAGILMLTRLGFTVLTAKGGREAVEVYIKNRGRINAVILDMIMPEVGGGKVYDRLKEIDPNVKVLLSSGYSIDGQATEILSRGCDGFIQKPFSMNELSAKLREIMD